MIPLHEARKKLAGVWFVGAGVLLIIVILQSIGGEAYKTLVVEAATHETRYENLAGDAFSWLLPTVLPTLTLIMAVFLSSAGDKSEPVMVDKYFYRLSLYLSIFYLVIAISSFGVRIYSDSMSQLEALKLSNLWLGPMQGLVSGSIGFFFAKAKHSSSVPKIKKKVAQAALNNNP